MAKAALTTPIATTATDYVLDACNFDFEGGTVTLQYALLDAAGARVKVETLTDSLANVGGAVQAQATAIRTAVVNYLKAKNKIN